MKPETRYGLLAVLYGVLADTHAVSTLSRRFTQTTTETEAQVRSLISSVESEDNYHE